MSLFRCDHAPLIAQLRADLAAADARAASAEVRHDALAERYDALVRASLRPQGVHIPEGGREARALEPTKPDPLKALIYQMAGDDLRKRAMMLRQLQVDRGAGVSEEDIESAIRTGVSSDGVPS